MPYQQPLWSQRYPELVKILDDQPAAPKGNRVARNICVGGQWLESDTGTEKLTAFEDNLISGDAGLVAPDKGDFRLKDDSPAIKAGFRLSLWTRSGSTRTRIGRACPGSRTDGGAGYAARANLQR